MKKIDYQFHLININVSIFSYQCFKNTILLVHINIPLGDWNYFKNSRGDGPVQKIEVCGQRDVVYCGGNVHSGRFRIGHSKGPIQHFFKPVHFCLIQLYCMTFLSFLFFLFSEPHTHCRMWKWETLTSQVELDLFSWRCNPIFVITLNAEITILSILQDK